MSVALQRVEPPVSEGPETGESPRNRSRNRRRGWTRRLAAALVRRLLVLLAGSTAAAVLAGGGVERLVRASLRQDRHALSVTALVWTAAAVMAYVAASAAHDASEARARAASVAVVPRLDILRQSPPSATEIDALLEPLRGRFPSVTMKRGDGESVLVLADHPGAFNDWVASLMFVQAQAPDLRWSVRSLCAGDCAGTRFRAEVTVRRIAVAPDAPRARP